MSNKELGSQILHLEKQLQESKNRANSKSSSQSVHNTTQSSRKTEIDKDRLITNMKVVHESEIRKLKAVIEELKKSQSGGSTRKN